jgi:large subunit ribosomal protein L18
MDKLHKFSRRKSRVRSQIKKVSGRYRLTVFKSNRHIRAQIIDDMKGHTLVSVSTLDSTLRQENKSNCNREMAAKIGEIISQKACAQNISEVVFDRGGYKFHGIIKSLADAARVNLSF